MAESILIGLSSKILSTIASDAFKKAYQKGISIREARDELANLQVTIEAIQAVVIDAENKQEGSLAVKNLIQRLKGVLYDAEDLFDEIATEDLIMQHMTEGKDKLSLKNKVLVSCSKVNSIVFRNSIANKVKTIKKRLAGISTNMAPFGFVHCLPEKQIVSMKRKEYNARCSTDVKYVIGRDEDMKVVLEMLFNESDTVISEDLVVTAITGIGGMGKTTLADQIYNDENVIKNFEKRWFARISDTYDEAKILGEIYQSITGAGYSNLNVFQLHEKIKGSIAEKKYLLVLDDVWENDRGKWENRKNLLSRGAKGSKIIVTTRLPSVVSAVGAGRTHTLSGLSDNDSWSLFKRLAFGPDYDQTDPEKERVGRELLKRCRGLPLAICCMSSLLHDKTISEWEEIQRASISTLGGKNDDETMSVLKLSYDHLPSNLKQCFTYCSLFPKGYRYEKEELLDHWIAQGFVEPEKKESDLRHLLRMGFFQEVEEDDFGEIKSCKMHDVMHDLALYLGSDESTVLSSTSSSKSSCTRYVRLTVDGRGSEPWNFPTSLPNVKSLRACLVTQSRPGVHNFLSVLRCPPNLDRLCSNFRYVRTLTLSRLEIEHIPCSLGELKLMRYLDLSYNNFKELPNSITNLVNLLILNLEMCRSLEMWPRDFKKLTKLWSLNIRGSRLRLMPEGIGGMVRLQYLSDFMVGKVSELDALTGLLEQLRGCIWVEFCLNQNHDQLEAEIMYRLNEVMDVEADEVEVENEWRWQLPAASLLQDLIISFYPGQSLGGWEDNVSAPKLKRLQLRYCKKVKYLPPLRRLPILKKLTLWGLQKLEFMEEVNTDNPATSQKLFFPCLAELVLLDMPKLKGWCSRKVAARSPSSTPLELPRLSKLSIESCPNLELKSLPLCPHLRELRLVNAGDNASPATQREIPATFSYLEKIDIGRCKWLSSISGEELVSLRKLSIKGCCGLKSLHLTSPYLLDICISECDELTSIELLQRPKPSLQRLIIDGCKQLKSLHIDTHLVVGLKEMSITKCPELRLSNTREKVETLKLHLSDVDSVLIQQSLSVLSMSSLQRIFIYGCKGSFSLAGAELTSLQVCCVRDTDGLASLHIPSPHLQEVSLWNCVALTSVKVEAPTGVHINSCPDLKCLRIADPSALVSVTFTSLSIPGVDWGSIPNLGDCSRIHHIDLEGVDGFFIEQLLSSSSASSSFKSIGDVNVALASLESFTVKEAHGLNILNFKSPRLRRVQIDNCNGLTSVELDSAFRNSDKSSYLWIHRCSHLKNVRVAHPISLQDLLIADCMEMSLSTGVDWESLTDLNT